LLTQRKVSQEIIDGHGDYVMIVKENQKALMNDVKTVFDGPCMPFPKKNDTLSYLLFVLRIPPV
jgi:hypothetical protein